MTALTPAISVFTHHASVLCHVIQSDGAVRGAAPEEASGGEGGSGSRKHGSLSRAEPPPDDGGDANRN